MAALPFKVRGQEGAIPAIGLGTATLFNAQCTEAVRAAIRMGYRYLDTALLYNNQEAVGAAVAAAIAAGEVTREQLFIVSKVAFYPAAADGTNTDIHIRYEPLNKKGHAETLAAVDLCLAKLGLGHVDLMLIHNPCTDIAEYQASGCAHNFELSKSRLTPAERALVMGSRLAAAHARFDAAAGQAARAASWKALEEARAAGKCRYIGVSNYSPYLLREMEAYAAIQPAVNQLELHPRASSPALRALAASMGLVLTGYGSGNSVAIERCATTAAIASAHGVTPVAVVLAWTLARGVGVIPRTATPAHMEENLRAGQVALTPAELAALDAKNQAHFYCACSSSSSAAGRQASPLDPLFSRPPPPHAPHTPPPHTPRTDQTGTQCRASPRAPRWTPRAAAVVNWMLSD